MRLRPSITGSGILDSRSISSGSTSRSKNSRSSARKRSPFSTAAGSSCGWGWIRSNRKLPRNSSLPKLGSFHSDSRAASATSRACLSETVLDTALLLCDGSGVSCEATRISGGAMKLSARNQLAGKVTSINKGEAIANVVLDVAGQRLVASITVEAVADLGLSEGSQVTAIIKASDVMIATDGG